MATGSSLKRDVNDGAISRVKVIYKERLVRLGCKRPDRLEEVFNRNEIPGDATVVGSCWVLDVSSAMAKKYGDWISSSADVSTAFLHALSSRTIFVRWRLKRSLYGCWDWSAHLMTVLDEACWIQSAVDKSVYLSKAGSQESVVVVHVDGLVMNDRSAVVHQRQEKQNVDDKC